MLSNEEKKAIDLLKNIDKQKCVMLECPVVKNNIKRQLKIIELNKIIRKQSKEIEGLKDKNKELEDTLKQTQNSWYEDTKVIEKQSKEIEELKNITKSYDSFLGTEKIVIADKKFFVNGYFKENYVSKDKIKSKIEELEKLDFGTDLVSQFTANLTTITILQSLLEKEFPVTITKEELQERWKE